jgi:predicted  nucleic acid-binding Zn-ribbon protein
MSPDLDGLIRLQSLDTAIADATSRIAAHPQRVAEADAKLSGAQQLVEAAKARLKDSQDARRALEKDAAVYQARLDKFKDQLMAVKTNREYAAMQHEIATAQQELGAVEEKVLERMMEADAFAAEVKQAEAALATARKEVEAERKTLEQELTSEQSALAQASAARAALVRELQPRLVALFEQVAKLRKGVAISTATRDGLCAVCHVRLRPPVFQQVRHNDSIVQCESCQRILYYVPPPAPPVGATVVSPS